MAEKKWDFQDLEALIKEGNIKKIEKILHQKEFDINQVFTGRFSAWKHNEPVKELASGTCCDETLLSTAVKYDQYDIAKLLLDHNADPNFFSECLEETPLTMAVENNKLAMIELLVKHGAHIDAQHEHNVH